MKKIFLIVLSLLLLTACSKEEKSNNENMIYTSIYPIEFITKEIVGDKIEVKNIIPTGVESHGWEPTMKNIASMSESEIIFINGLGMESWKGSVKETIGEDKLIEVNKGLDLIKLTDREVDEENKYDPHIWLSIRNMEKISKNIFDEIVKIDSKNKDYYENNYNGLLGRLKDLDDKFSEGLKDYNGKSIIVPHEAFGYLVRDYNLKQLPIENINSSSEADLGTIANIVEIAKEEGIKTVFYEYNENEKLASTVATEIDGDLKEIYTLENITDEQINNNEDYFTIMEKNLNNILESFK